MPSIIPADEVTKGLATWAATYGGSASSDAAVTWARHALMDWFACTIAGAREPLADIVVALFI